MIPTDDLLDEQRVAFYLEHRERIVAAAKAGCFLGRKMHLAGQAMAEEIGEYLDAVGDRMERAEMPSADHTRRLRDSARILQAHHLERLDTLNR